MRVILVGFMGSGKTTLGKKIANKLGVPFIDSDNEIEAHYGKSIGQIFVESGESHFRAIESEYLEALNLREDFVLATGGGMPCFGNNMDRLNLLGTSFYLERSPKELTHRLIKAKAKRPLIDGMEEGELLQYVENTLLKREEYYQKAHITLSRSEQKPDQVVAFMHHLRQPQPQKS
jgi:shikimate kinase